VELSYPPEVSDALERLGRSLGGIAVKDELAGSEAPLELWGGEASEETPELTSGLGQVAEMRKLGEYALPLGGLLSQVGRRYLPTPRKWSRGGVTPLGWPDVTAPWRPGDQLAARFDGSKVSGRVFVAPFCVPANRVILLADGAGQPVLLKGPAPNPGSTERLGDAFAVTFEGSPVILLAEGAEAVAAWQRLVTWERLALLGLTAGAIDRAWRIALDALCEGKRQGNPLADEQVAQFQLADNDIERLSAGHLINDAAIDVEAGKPHSAEKLALARYFTAAQAERCAARALHVAQLFLPRMVPIAGWLVKRAHHLSVFNSAREHEVQAATAGLVAGMSLE